MCNRDGVSEIGQRGETPIFIAAEKGRKECVETLAHLGGDVNAAATVSENSVHMVAGANCGVDVVPMT